MAPNYSAARSEMAKKLGLGARSRNAATRRRRAGPSRRRGDTRPQARSQESRDRRGLILAAQDGSWAAPLCDSSPLNERCIAPTADQLRVYLDITAAHAFPFARTTKAIKGL